MTGWPDGFDLRAEALGLLSLVEIDTPDGPARFMPGLDGVFRDVAGNAWTGSQLVSDGDLEWSRAGQAPEGQITLSYFQDPDAPDLIDQIKALGGDYIRGRAVRWYLQPIGSHAEFYAPVHPPVLIATRYARSPVYDFEGDVSRRISVPVEGAMAARRGARSYYYTTEDHARLTGAANPSLEFMPQENRQEEQLFG